MKLPGIKTLSAVFTDAKQARKILEMDRYALAELPAGKARIDGCYNPPKTYDVRMHCLNAIEPGLYGVEALEHGNDDVYSSYADYLNTGDVYAPTLIYWSGRYRVQSVGDFVEALERQGIKFK